MTGWLIDTLLMTGALMAAVLAVRRPVGRLFGPGIAYALWALPLIRMMLPPLVLPASLRPGLGWGSGGAPSLAAAPARVLPELAQAAVPGHGFPWAAVLLAVWLGGALVFLGWRAREYRAMRRTLLRGARPMGTLAAVRIVETPGIASPLAFGIRDKVVALPLGFLFHTDPAARELAIAHEFEHHAARDLAVNLAFQLLLALHWFDPVAWIAWRAMRQDQEAACDARVLAGRGREARLQYGRLIASLAAGPRLALAAPMAGPMTGSLLGRKAIVHRLRRIAAAEPTRQRELAGRAALMLGVLALPLTASISYAAGDQDKAPATRAVTTKREVRRVVIRQDDRADGAPGAPAHERVVERGGRTYVFRTEQPLSDAEVEARIARADNDLPEPPLPPLPPAPPLPGRAMAPAVPAAPAAPDGSVMPVPPAPPVPGVASISYSPGGDRSCDEAGGRIVGVDGRPNRQAMAQLKDCIDRQVGDALRQAGIARRGALRDAVEARRAALAGQAEARAAIGQARAEIDQDRSLSQSIRDMVTRSLDSALAGVGGQS